MKRLICGVLILCLLGALTACGREVESTGQTLPQPKEATDSLSALRADMKPPVIAIADFGFPELSEAYDIMDYLGEEYPEWLEENAYVRDMPRERIIRTCGSDACAQLLCVVPRDPASTVSVNSMRYEDGAETVVYRSESGEPILLLADISEDVKISVVVVDSEGRGVSWQPYWGNYDPIPADGHYGALVMDFTPLPEKTAYDRFVDSGWYTPDVTLLADRCWQSDYGYALELFYEPGQMYDGPAYLYDVYEDGEYSLAYAGSWVLSDGVLGLDMGHVSDGSLTIRGEFPVLTDPDSAGWLAVAPDPDGPVLPHFYEGLQIDELCPVGSDALSPYDYAISTGWRMPELSELKETFWLSWNGYALELAADAVPGYNGGWAKLYDVGDIGEYTASYNGSWTYENGLLYLSLVPLKEDGCLVDDSFPVLTLDGKLWIGRSHNGTGLPHFGFELLADTLQQPKG